MSSPAPPKFRNLKCQTKRSPVEIKEKMRKTYKDKVQKCRDMLLNRFRGTVDTEIRNTLNEIYKSMFNFEYVQTHDDEEIEILTEIKNELVNEELEWLIEEYEKTHSDNYDWSAVEEDNNVICPVCQKTNCTMQNHALSCSNCKFNINTQNTVLEIKQNLFELIEKHSRVCDKECQFTLLSESNETHIYLICDVCTEMQIVV